MDEIDLKTHQHRRYNPLLDTWVLVSPHRMDRPWKGGVEKAQEEHINNHDNFNNPLRPLGTRPNNIINPDYKDTFIFENDFPAIREQQFKVEQENGSPPSLSSLTLPPSPSSSSLPSTPPTPSACDLFQCQPAYGKCYVVCYHPSPLVSLATMSPHDITKVLQKLIETCLMLQHKYTWIQIFENKGEIMGCSNPHPHCQIWATSFLPTEPSMKDTTQRNYFLKHKRPMLLDYINLEIEKKERIVLETMLWVCVVPYWASWPYETYLIPKRHVLRLQDLKSSEVEDLSVMMKQLLCKYDNLFHTSFPYSMGWHGAPTGKHLTEDSSHWQLHAVYLPPLLRSASVKKFMVGFEMLAEAQRDLTAERAAETLRELPTKHYKQESN